MAGPHPPLSVLYTRSMSMTSYFFYTHSHLKGRSSYTMLLNTRNYRRFSWLSLQKPIFKNDAADQNQQQSLFSAQNYTSENAKQNNATSITQHMDITAPQNIFGLVIVPEAKACVVERLGRFSRILNPGLNIVVPVLERIAYVHTLKEVQFEIASQAAITADNVQCVIDGVLFYRTVDPKAASYNIENASVAMTQLAQTTMRSEIGKMSLDNTFSERETLNHNIVQSINSASNAWGIVALRYEIKDIVAPERVRIAMDMQVEAERKKRAYIFDSEATQQAEINMAQGSRAATIYRAEGDARAIELQAAATGQAIKILADAISHNGGSDAVALRIAEQYVEAFGKLAKEGNTVLLPAGLSDPSSMIAQALSIYSKMSPKTAVDTTPVPSR